MRRRRGPVQPRPAGTKPGRCAAKDADTGHGFLVAVDLAPNDPGVSSIALITNAAPISGWVSHGGLRARSRGWAIQAQKPAPRSQTGNVGDHISPDIDSGCYPGVVDTHIGAEVKRSACPCCQRSLKSRSVHLTPHKQSVKDQGRHLEVAGILNRSLPLRQRSSTLPEKNFAIIPAGRQGI